VKLGGASPEMISSVRPTEIVPVVLLAWIVKFCVSSTVGVPVIAPVEVLSDSPVGRLPELIE